MRIASRAAALLLGLLGACVMAASDWKIVPNVDAVPAAGPNTRLLGSVSELAQCEALCAATAGCNLFTWNHALAPHHCFGGVDPEAAWQHLPNTHCTSGCRGAACAASPDLPSWAGLRPSVKINATAGLPPLPGVEHFTVYNATQDGQRNPFGVYNHGPILARFQGLLYMSWYNAPEGERTGKRPVFATSKDGKVWGAPTVLFPPFTQQPCPTCGEENGPWTILGSGSSARLYIQAGTQDAGEHHEGIISVMRQVGVGGDPTALGAPFWLNRSVPSYCQNQTEAECRYPTYLDMDARTRADAEQLLASLVRTLVRAPDASHPAHPAAPAPMAYNERSLYLVPGTRRLMLLLRGVPPGLSASTCTLPEVPRVAGADLSSCRPGAGDAFMNLVELAANFSAASDPRECNWTVPVMTSVPDSEARTCTAPLPNGGGVYLVGNQIDKGRDPVTLSVARDGLFFDRHWAVRYGALPPRYPGQAKGPGFQYPAALVLADEGVMMVCYSVAKEDIAVTHFPLSAIAP